MKKKRGRKSTRKKQHRHTQQQERAQEEHGGAGGASMSDVPGPVLMDIFSRLSVNSIFRCRCVCKFWFDLLLDPVFAKLHFSRAPTCPLLRDSGERRISRALYLIELDRDDDSFICNNVSDKSCTTTTTTMKKMELSTIFLLPEGEASSSRTKRSDRRFDIVNSCNGFLCLRGSLFNCPIVIHNPVNGDYSVLPKPEVDKEEGATVCGLGFCPKTNRYKVLVIIWEPVKECSGRVALIYTLGGLGGWRRIGNAPFFRCGISCPVFVNGAIHWLVEDYQMRKSIVSFDFVGEQFHTIPLPRAPAFSVDEMLQLSLWPTEIPAPISHMRLGVLRGRLYIVCNSFYSSHIGIWKMKDYGVKESWFKQYHIDTPRPSDERRPLGFSYQPIDFLNNGDLLMYHERSKALICIDKHKLNRCFEIGETASEFQFVAHVPSFVSLKDIMGDTLAVFNVRSSLANTGPRKKIGACLVLVEADWQTMLGSDCSG